MVTSPPTYTIIELPVLGRDEVSPTDQAFIVDRWRSTRLFALQNDPEAYATSYETVKDQPLESWTQRLSNPRARHFIALAGQPDDGPTASLANEWCGSIVMLGPDTSTPSANTSPWKTAEKPTSTPHQEAASSTPQQQANYHLAGTYTHPSHRRQGIGRSLLQKTLQVAIAESQTLKSSLLITVHVDTANHSARSMHEAFGFACVGEEAYQPQPTAAGPRAEKQAYLLELRRPLGHL